MKVELSAPNAKMLEPRNKEKGLSVLKDQNKILKSRSRNHARDVELDELITTNDEKYVKQNQWIREDGRKRRKIDDI